MVSVNLKIDVLFNLYFWVFLFICSLICIEMKMKTTWTIFFFGMWNKYGSYQVDPSIKRVDEDHKVDNPFLTQTWYDSILIDPTCLWGLVLTFLWSNKWQMNISPHFPLSNLTLGWYGMLLLLHDAVERIEKLQSAIRLNSNLWVVKPWSRKRKWDRRVQEKLLKNPTVSF